MTQADATTYALYEIAEHLIDALRKKLDTIARRAKRLGVGEVTYKVSEATHLVAWVNGGTGWVRWDWLKGHAPSGAKYREYHWVELTATTPRMEGWDFAATLQHEAGEDGRVINLLRKAPGFAGELPHRFRDANPNTCEHCGKTRKRTDTFVVYSPATEEWKQVGRSCLCDFLGGHDPHRAVKMLQAGLDAAGVCGSDEEDGFGWGGGSGGPKMTGTDEFLAWTASVVRHDGWVSRGKARNEDVQATADQVLYLITEPFSLRADVVAAWKKAREEYAPADCDVAQANAALAYARETLGEKGAAMDDYEHNLYVAVQLDAVGHRTAGIAASLIPYYLKKIEAQVAAKAATGNQHVGTVGVRSDFYVTLQKIIAKESFFGTTLIHKLVDRDGNQITWFASTHPGMEQGVEYRIAATVKDHGEYKGIKQTVVSRVTVYTEEGRRQAEEKEAKQAAREAARAAKGLPPKPVRAAKALTPEQIAEKAEKARQRAEAARQAAWEREMNYRCRNYIY